ncbi:MAG: DUF3375 domain-containing protein [Acidimicrobiales bacterium]
MNYDEIEHLQSNHPAWSLLRSPNAALVMSFLGRVFVDANVADLPGSQLANELDDDLYALNQRLRGERLEDRFPKTAPEYLDDWAAPERGWLRKFYPPGSDEPRYDVAPAVEKALMWVSDLRSREFIGTESRLNTIFDLLRQMVFGAESDPERRLSELRRRRVELDEEISQAEGGEFHRLDSVGQRDRYQQFSRTARELQSDFRQVEKNFRRLDRSLRQQITGWTGSKGALLADAVDNRHSITESDQGRSFQAFYDFLLSHRRQAELSDLLERLQRVEEIQDHDARLAHVHFDWIDACERTQSTVRLLSDQLRRFLDHQVWVENRRVFDLLRGIEAKALCVRDVRDPALVMEIDELGVTVGLPMERTLHRRPAEVPLDDAAVAAGSGEFDASALVTQMYIDRARLAQRVWGALGPDGQVGLRHVLETEPLSAGLAELLGYMSLTEPGLTVVFDTTHREQVAWTVKPIEGQGVTGEDDEQQRVAELPRVAFARHRKEAR